MANVRVGPDYIEYWQGASAAQRGLTSRFGVLVKEGSFSAIFSLGGGQSDTFGRLYELPVQPDILPTYLRLIIDSHAQNCPDTDLMDVLAGRKSFKDALVTPRKREVQSATRNLDTVFLAHRSGTRR